MPEKPRSAELPPSSVIEQDEQDCDSYDSDKFLKLRIRVMHDGANVNGSRFAVESMRDAEESIKNVPILANVVLPVPGAP